MATRRQVLLLLCVVPATLAQTKLDQEQVWREYIEWLRAQPLGPNTQEQYRARLRNSGLTEVQVDERFAVIEKLSRVRLEPKIIFFNKAYTSPKPMFNTAPNAFLAEVIQEVKPGKALDVHMGQGRNAVYLAQKGWDVTGFDLSDQGLAVAQCLAEKAGVKIKTILQSHEEFDFGRDRWDLVVMMYTWIPMSDLTYAKRICESLKPGGLLVFEHHLEELKPGEEKTAWLPEPNQLFKVFGDLRVLRYEDRLDTVDWGKGKGRVGRLLAQKM